MALQDQRDTRRAIRAPVVVLGTIGHDAHIVGSSILRIALEEAGFKVVFLGAVVPPQEFIDAARESAADAILVSSLYGMARIDCNGRWETLAAMVML